jgi:hypothetical protein
MNASFIMLNTLSFFFIVGSTGGGGGSGIPSSIAVIFTVTGPPINVEVPHNAHDNVIIVAGGIVSHPELGGVTAEQATLLFIH